uniref:Uncharacterized protein n=1 Tax=Timema bartmani TaxID=61472 RepID=A0A7R9EZY9_9NEOP|nr:unnamed protein product [Timema bartmani]
MSGLTGVQGVEGNESITSSSVGSPCVTVNVKALGSIPVRAMHEVYNKAGGADHCGITHSGSNILEKEVERGADWCTKYKQHTITSSFTDASHRHHLQEGINCCGELALSRSSLKTEETFPPSAPLGVSMLHVCGVVIQVSMLHVCGVVTQISMLHVWCGHSDQYVNVVIQTSMLHVCGVVIQTSMLHVCGVVTQISMLQSHMERLYHTGGHADKGVSLVLSDHRINKAHSCVNCQLSQQITNFHVESFVMIVRMFYYNTTYLLSIQSEQRDALPVELTCEAARHDQVKGPHVLVYKPSQSKDLMSWFTNRPSQRTSCPGLQTVPVKGPHVLVYKPTLQRSVFDKLEEPHCIPPFPSTLVRGGRSNVTRIYMNINRTSNPPTNNKSFVKSREGIHFYGHSTLLLTPLAICPLVSPTLLPVLSSFLHPPPYSFSHLSLGLPPALPPLSQSSPLSSTLLLTPLAICPLVFPTLVPVLSSFLHLPPYSFSHLSLGLPPALPPLSQSSPLSSTLLLTPLAICPLVFPTLVPVLSSFLHLPPYSFSHLSLGLPPALPPLSQSSPLSSTLLLTPLAICPLVFPTLVPVLSSFLHLPPYSFSHLSLGLPPALPPLSQSSPLSSTLLLTPFSHLSLGLSQPLSQKKDRCTLVGDRKKDRCTLVGDRKKKRCTAVNLGPDTWDQVALLQRHSDRATPHRLRVKSVITTFVPKVEVPTEHFDCKPWFKVPEVEVPAEHFDCKGWFKVPEVEVPAEHLDCKGWFKVPEVEVPVEHIDCKGWFKVPELEVPSILIVIFGSKSLKWRYLQSILIVSFGSKPLKWRVAGSDGTLLARTVFEAAVAAVYPARGSGVSSLQGPCNERVVRSYPCVLQPATQSEGDRGAEIRNLHQVISWLDSFTPDNTSPFILKGGLLTESKREGGVEREGRKIMPYSVFFISSHPPIIINLAEDDEEDDDEYDDVEEVLATPLENT